MGIVKRYFFKVNHLAHYFNGFNKLNGLADFQCSFVFP